MWSQIWPALTAEWIEIGIHARTRSNYIIGEESCYVSGCVVMCMVVWEGWCGLQSPSQRIFGISKLFPSCLIHIAPMMFHKKTACVISHSRLVSAIPRTFRPHHHACKSKLCYRYVHLPCLYTYTFIFTWTDAVLTAQSSFWSFVMVQGHVVNTDTPCSLLWDGTRAGRKGGMLFMVSLEIAGQAQTNCKEFIPMNLPSYSIWDWCMQIILSCGNPIRTHSPCMKTSKSFGWAISLGWRSLS